MKLVAGTKIDALRLNGDACLQVDEKRDEFHLAEVYGHGDGSGCPLKD